jgi:hypothetical protein
MVYPPSAPPHKTNFNEYLYIHGHFARYPIDKLNNADVACLFRDPLDRAISTFLHIYDKTLFFSNKYKNIDSFIDKLRFYLFEDLDYISHNNIQSKFISSSPKINISINKHGEPVWRKEKNKTWGLEEKDIDINLVKKNLNDFKIIGITERHDDFMHNINQWFLLNHKVQIKLEKKILNKSSVIFDGIEYSTKILKEMLLEKDCDKFLNNNQIDLQLYNYVKTKLEAATCPIGKW